MNDVVIIWKSYLSYLLRFYETKRGSLTSFFPKLFFFFVLLNIFCYWWAMFTAFPELTRGNAGVHYFKMQFPVGILGALFDSFSFFITIHIIRSALKSQTASVYFTHLSLDLVIAVLATFWVLFVFSSSGWLISLLEDNSLELAVRNEVYEEMLVEAIVKPADNLRNIYFGLTMGVSASLPTCVHLFMFIRSCLQISNNTAG